MPVQAKSQNQIASIYKEGLREAQRHKWIESQKRDATSAIRRSATGFANTGGAIAAIDAWSTCAAGTAGPSSTMNPRARSMP